MRIVAGGGLSVQSATRHEGTPMPRLIYSAIVSLDGYHVDRDGGFGWAEPGDEAFAFITAREKPVGTYLYGRRMYETMTCWETDPTFAEQSPLLRDFAETWQAAEKIVYSTTLTATPTACTRIEREFDPDTVRALKASSRTDLGMGGPVLAAHALRAGLVDEIQVYLAPRVVGGGTPYLPADLALALELQEHRRFADGMVFLRYDVGT